MKWYSQSQTPTEIIPVGTSLLDKANCYLSIQTPFSTCRTLNASTIPKNRLGCILPSTLLLNIILQRIEPSTLCSLVDELQRGIAILRIILVP